MTQAHTPDSARNIEQEIGQRGLQAGLFEEFTKLSQTGKAFLEQIIESAEKKEEERQSLLAQFTETLKKEIMVLLHILKHKEAKAHHKQQLDSEAAELISHHLAKHDTVAPTATSNVRVDEKKELNGMLNEVHQQVSKTAVQYQAYDHNIAQAEHFIATLPENKEDQIKALEDEIARLEGTQAQRDLEADEVFRMIDAGQEQEGRARLDALNAKNVQVGALKDMLAVSRGDKKLYDSKGQLTQSFSEAQFVLAKEQHLIKEGDDFYLLPQEQSLSSTNQAQAKQAFTRQKNELSSVRHLINANKAIALGDLSKQVVSIKQRIETLHQDHELEHTQAQKQAVAQTPAPKTPKPSAPSFEFNTLSALPDSDPMKKIIHELNMLLDAVPPKPKPQVEHDYQPSYGMTLGA